MITAKQIATALGFPPEHRLALSVTGDSVTLVDMDDSEPLIKPWHQTYAQACWDAGEILPYDETKAEQLYNWEKAGVPLSVTRRQLLLELYITDGTEEEDILTAINGIQDAQTKAIALIEFKQALTFDRDNPFVAQIGGLLGLSESDINDRFKESAKR